RTLRARRVRRGDDHRGAPPREHRATPGRPRAEGRPAANLGVSVAVIGGGSWGTALAIHASRSGSPVRLWAREREVVEAVRARRRSPWYLTDIDVPPAVAPTLDQA